VGAVVALDAWNGACDRCCCPFALAACSVGEMTAPVAADITNASTRRIERVLGQKWCLEQPGQLLLSRWYSPSCNHALPTCDE
jgi:hypothetical protein